MSQALDAKTRILIVIDCLSTYGYDTFFSGFNHDNDEVKEKDFSEIPRAKLEEMCKQGFKLMADIYTFAHVGVGLCGNPHEDWVKSFLETEAACIKDKMIPHPAKPQDKSPDIDLPIPQVTESLKSIA